MSIGGRDPRFKKSAAINGNILSPLQDYWERPSDWLELPALATSQEVVGLVAVFDQPNNYLSFRCSGNYTVDWGDGSSPVNVSAGVTAEYNYTYSSISSTTDTTRGYRQVIVKITPQAGQNLTSLSFTGFAHSSQLTTTTPNAPWLDMRMTVPNATSLTFNSSQLRLTTLERLEILDSALGASWFNLLGNCPALTTVYIKSSSATAVTDFRSVFANDTMLRNVFLDIGAGIAAGCDGGSTFSGCYSLRVSPAINFGTSGYFWNLASHFANCAALEQVFPYPTTSTTAFNSMFTGCTSLKAAPEMDTSSATTTASMFSGCTALVDVPLYDLNGVTTTNSMFNSCRNLETVPDFDLTTVQNLGTMFGNCNRLKQVPSSFANTTAATDMSSFLNGCQSVASIPTFDLNGVTTISAAFSTMQSLQVVPAMNANTVTTTMASTFSGASSITKIGLTNIGATITLPNAQLQKAQIEEVFDNLKRITSTLTITLGTNPGATLYNRSTTFTSGSATCTVNSATSLSTNMFVTSANLGATKAVTFQDTGDTVTLNNHGFANGKAVAFSVITTTTGITTYTTYYVVNATTNTFQLEATIGGGVLPLTTDGSGTILIMYKVNTIAGTTVTLDAPATATGTANAVFRDLNIQTPVFKGWTVSG